MARDFARRAQAAEDADDANRYARSYQRAARSYRQTLALKARLRRDLAAAAAHDAEAQAATPRPRPGRPAVARRFREMRTALLRLTWDEAERPEGERAEINDFDTPGETFAFWRPAIEDIVAEAGLKEDFCDAPLDDHVARLATDLGFAPAAIARWHDLPDPPAAALEVEPDDEDEWRSSA